MVNIFGDHGATDSMGRPGPQGKRGPRGEVGPPGKRGKDGSQGTAGEPGPKGDRGEVGPEGAIGPKGEVGKAGDRGEIGSKGDRGKDGSKGDRGKDGPKGDRGEKGTDGDRGGKGDRGEPGRDGLRGEKGVRGKNGKDAFDIVKWMPSFILYNFRKSAEFCYLVIKVLSEDLVKSSDGTYTAWISRSDKKINAEAEIASKKIRKISEHQWGLHFSKTLYTIKNVSLKSVLVCVTFQLDDDTGASTYTIFEDTNRSRGVSVTGKVITIYGVDDESNKLSFKYHTPINTWNTILVEWTPDRKQEGLYMVNDGQKRGSFKCNQYQVPLSPVIYLGGRTEAFNGSIASFEIYRSHHQMVPESIKDLIIKDQQI